MALIKPIYPTPLANKLKALLAVKLPRGETPPAPITYVDDNICKLSNNSIKARNMGIIPALCMVSFIAFCQIAGFYSTWKSNEHRIQERVEFHKKNMGKIIFSPQL